MTKVTEVKEKFVDIYTENIKRPGSEKLLNYLLSENSDFFVAPASTRYHGAYEGGLCEHSIHVYECLKSYLERERVKEDYNMEYSDATATPRTNKACGRKSHTMNFTKHCHMVTVKSRST